MALEYVKSEGPADRATLRVKLLSTISHLSKPFGS